MTQTIDETKVVRDVRSHTSLGDTILKLDRQQSIWNPTAKMCRVKDHGRLGVHASGAVLLCCVKHCEHQEYVSS